MSTANAGETNPGEPAGAPRRNWPRVLLMVSLAFNLLVIGAFAGRMLRHGPPDWRDGDSPRAFFHALPDDRRKELKSLLDADKAEADRRRDEIAKLRQAARDLIAKDTFDTAAVESAIGAVMAARVELRQLMTRSFIAALSRMTPEERRAFVKHRNRRWKERSGDF